MAFQELDAASRGTIDNVRGIVDDLPFVVAGARKRIILFDEAHRMSRDSQDVLLKPLEDKQMVGIFCTTEPHKIRGAIRSRCEEHTIRKITREDIFQRMKHILTTEKVEFEEDAVWTVIDVSGGHVRDVINKTEMVAQLGAVSLEAVREYLNLGAVTLYYEALLALDDPAKVLKLIDEVCDRVGPDEAAIGLAEAAMNSYRLSHGMWAEFVYVDRELAKQVHAKFGDSITEIARYLLRSRGGSKVGLLSDIVSLVEGGGKPIPQEVVESKVVIQPSTTTAPAPVAATPPTPAEKAPEPPQEASSPPKEAATPPEPESPPEPKKDVRALHASDHHGVADAMPRGSVKSPRIQESVRAKTIKESLTWYEWAREFERTWPGAQG